jgi:uncharacterized protein YbbC (DUF1343 family)
MDLILGDREVRTLIEKGTPIQEIEKDWQKELQSFDQTRKKYVLY